MTDTRERAAELCEEAAHIIEEYGWTQGQEYRSGVGFCAVGALKQAAGLRNFQHTVIPAEYDEIRAAYVTARHKLRFMTESPDIPLFIGDGIMWFNDKVAKNAQQVLDVLQRAAKELRS